MLQTCPEILVSVGSSTAANRVLAQLFPPTKTCRRKRQRDTKKAISAAIRAMMHQVGQVGADGQGAPIEISVWLATDAEITALNARYRGVDQPTDVLSFPMASEAQQASSLYPGGELLLGEVVISVEMAAHQAQLNRHDLLTEMLMLCLHGTLHLLGYDDQTEEQRAEMNRIAVQTLRNLGYPAKEEWCSRHYERRAE